MTFWEKIQSDIRKNIRDGVAIVKERSTVVSQRLEKLTEEGKRKYQIFMLNTKVKDEFARLGGTVYDLNQKSRNPMSNRKVVTIIAKIKKLEDRITALERKQKGLRAKTARKKPRTASRRTRRTARPLRKKGA